MEEEETPCVKCGGIDQEEFMLLCDKCDAGFHTFCLESPLEAIPDGDWFCPFCSLIKTEVRLPSSLPL